MQERTAVHGEGEASWVLSSLCTLLPSCACTVFVSVCLCLRSDSCHYCFLTLSVEEGVIGADEAGAGAGGAGGASSWHRRNVGGLAKVE
eukprot:3342702-Rhodomonas_salina.1